MSVQVQIDTDGATPFVDSIDKAIALNSTHGDPNGCGFEKMKTCCECMLADILIFTLSCCGCVLQLYFLEGRP